MATLHSPPAGDLGATLKLLADPTRLRILALLEREELAVGELSRALGMAQSRVSNHLRLLREAGCLGERHAGTSTYLHLGLEPEGGGLMDRLWREVRTDLDGLPEQAADLVRLEAVLGARGEAGFFDRAAGDWDKIAGGFRSDLGRERAVGHLLSEDLVVADLGCGTGYVGSSLLGRVARLISVDSSEGMLAEARARLERVAGGRRGTELEFRSGGLDDLPLADAEVDGTVAALVLHHLAEPDAALAEMRRVLRPGGTAVVLELAPHREAWMRDALGDRHLGLEPADVAAAMARAGFEQVVLDPVEDRYLPERPESAGGGRADLPLYIVRGRRPRVRMPHPTHPRTTR